MTNIADSIRIEQNFDPEGENGGYKCEVVKEVPEIKPRLWDHQADAYSYFLKYCKADVKLNEQITGAMKKKLEEMDRETGKAAMLSVAYGGKLVENLVQASAKAAEMQAKWEAAAEKKKQEIAEGVVEATDIMEAQFVKAQQEVLNERHLLKFDQLKLSSHITYVDVPDGELKPDVYYGVRTGRWSGGEGE